MKLRTGAAWAVVAGCVAIIAYLAIRAAAPGDQHVAGTSGTLGLLVVSLTVGLLAGASARVSRRAPWAAAGLVAAAYAALLAWKGLRAAQCPGCSDGDGDRTYYFGLFAAYYGVLAAWAVACIVAGTLALSAFRRTRERR